MSPAPHRAPLHRERCRQGPRHRDVRRVEPRRALTSALTIAGAYIAGGFVPLGPYVFSASAAAALVYSVIVTGVALLLFDAIKGRFTGKAPVRSALQTALIGGLAAGAAYMIARMISAA